MLGLLVAAGRAAAQETAPLPAPVQRPNLLFILADDLGWSDTTLYGTTRLYRTPNLERLAARGRLFTRAYSASPVCSPTRASLLTGLTPLSTGITQPGCHLPQAILAASVRGPAPVQMKTLLYGSATRLDTRYVTLAEVLHQAGYATGHFGKWHLGPEPYSALQQGFDVDVPHFSGSGPPQGYLAPWGLAGLEEAKPGDALEARMAAEAVAFLERNKDRTFFLNYWQFSVHPPFGARPEAIEAQRQRIDPASPQRSPTYAAMVEALDEAVGTLLDALDRLGLSGKTVVVFTSDNGGNMYSRLDGTTPTSNAPLRGCKGTIFEGGVRVPCIVSWPGVTPPGTRSDARIQSTDFFPTLLGLLGLPRPSEQRCDGVDFAPALRGEPFERGPMFTFYPHQPRVPDTLPPAISVHLGKWKLIRLFHQGEGGAHEYRLFDLEADEGEAHDLAAAMPERVLELDARIEAFLTESKALVPRPNPDYRPGPGPLEDVAGWTASRVTTLTLEDGELVLASSGKDPWIATRDLPEAQGPFTLRLRVKSSCQGQASVAYSDRPIVGFRRGESVPWPVQHDGQWHEYAVELPVARLTALRLDPGTGAGAARIASMVLEDAAGKEVKRWRFESGVVPAGGEDDSGENGD